MRFGLFEIILIIAVFLSVAVIWRWWRQGQPSSDERYDDHTEEEASQPSFFQRMGIVGVLLVLGGLGLLIVSYIIVVGLAKMFIWAVAFVLLGVAFLLLSRR